MRSASSTPAQSQPPGRRSPGSKRSSPARAPKLGAAERDREFLEHASAKSGDLAPEEGEETRLAEQRAAMQAGVKAGELLTGLDELLGGSEGALALLRQAARRIERGAADHPLLAEALASLDRVADRSERGRRPDCPRRRCFGVRSRPA